MLHDGSRADLMCDLPGVGGDLQHLSEGPECVSSCLGRVVRTTVSDDNDPQRVVPAGVAVGGEYTGNAPRDRFGVIARQYDNPDSPDFR